jgi:Tol biopolymer transport system component
MAFALLAATIATAQCSLRNGQSEVATTTIKVTSQITESTTIDPLLTKTETPSAHPSLIATPTINSVMFSVCAQSTSPGRKDLSVSFVADWDGDWEIYLVNADGSRLIQLTDNDASDNYPQWSPDGRKIAYVLDFSRNARLYVSAPTGSEGHILAPDIEITSDIVWSPTGKTIVFRSGDDLYAVDIESGETQNLTKGANFAPGLPSFSPDGSKMVLHVGLPQETPSHRMFTANADGTGLTELSFSQGDISRPIWHPSKDKILFEGFIEGEGNDVYVADLDGSISSLGISHEYRPSLVNWSPDGTMIAYHAWDSPPSIEGPVRHALRVRVVDSAFDVPVIKPGDDPESELNISRYEWGPDSRHIAYSTRTLVEGDYLLDLYVLDICTGTSELVAQDIAGPFGTPSWRPLP